MERIGSETVYEGKIIDVRTDTFRYSDGEEAEREIVAHPGAVGIVAHGDGVVWLVRQPREAVSDPELLEVPAGKLDVEGESRLDCAKRELEEEVGPGGGGLVGVEAVLHQPGLRRRGGDDLRGDGLDRGRGLRAGPRGADRDREVAARRSRRGDRGVPRLEVADRPPHAARAPRCQAPCLAPVAAARDATWFHAANRVQWEGRGAARGNERPWPSPSSRRRTRKVEARFEALVLDFLAYLEFERGLARNTLDAYRTDLLQFGIFLADRRTGATDVERADVSEFLAELATWAPRERRRSGAAAVLRRRRSAARRRVCARSTATFAARS